MFIPLNPFSNRTHVRYVPPPTGVCIWWVGTVSTDAEDWGSWWSGRFAGPGLFYIPLSQSLSPLLKRYNPPEWRRGSLQQTSSSNNSSWWLWGRGWSLSSPHWRSPSWSSWPGPPGRWCPMPRWRPARWWCSGLRRRLFPQEWWLDSPSSWWALSSPSRTWRTTHVDQSRETHCWRYIMHGWMWVHCINQRSNERNLAMPSRLGKHKKLSFKQSEFHTCSCFFFYNK